MASGILFLVLAGTSRAQTLTVLTNLDGTNGFYPHGTMVVGSDGNLYGTSDQGGTNGDGSLFKVTVAGAVIPLYTCSSISADASHGGQATNAMGAYLYAGLTLGNDGSTYGVASSGGTNAAGTFLKLSTNGSLTLLATFGWKQTNSSGVNTNLTGANPEGKLALGADGSFYGTAYLGGLYGRGAVFRAATNGTLTALASFNGINGSNPEAGLTAGKDGNFYGATYGGGASGNGTIFKITTNGLLTSLYSFSTGGVTASFTYTNAEGINPSANLTLGNDGLLYGTTHSGGTNGHGTVFKVTTNGLLTVLAQFNTTNGATSLSPLTLGIDGNFYGTTAAGGTNGNGTIFKLTTTGTFTSLYSFHAKASNGSVSTNDTGANPYAGLALGDDGSLYGTTTAGGGAGEGTVFKFAMPSTSLAIRLLATNAVLSWNNVALSLLSATQATGPFNLIPGATSPYTNPVVGGRKFFRLSGN